MKLYYSIIKVRLLLHGSNTSDVVKHWLFNLAVRLHKLISLSSQHYQTYVLLMIIKSAALLMINKSVVILIMIVSAFSAFKSQAHIFSLWSAVWSLIADLFHWTNHIALEWGLMRQLHHLEQKVRKPLLPLSSVKA